VTTDQLFADRYRLEGRLGVGGMSTVERAFDTRLERPVAVKLLAEHLAADSGFVARFRREALSAARLVHPNVVQVFDFGSDEQTGRQYIVMELVDGESCAEILRDQGPLDPAGAVHVLTQACRALDYAHRNGVIHRDVKPGNLLRNREGVIKLADFGIAKAAEQSDITKVGSVVGTAAYLSPEQTRGNPAGPASDLYALGVVAYQLLTGRLPYEGPSLTELARLQESGPPEPLHRVNPDVPPELGAAVARALQPYPEARYASAAEMEHALRDGLRGVAPPPPATARTAPAGDDTTSVLGRTEATTAMPPQRRRLTPLEEAPRTPVPVPAPSRARRSPARRRGRGLRVFTWLVVLLVLAVAGVLIYSALGDTGTARVERKPVDTQLDLDQSAQELRDLIDSNTR
jgi:eukaryotic-like serine/threonine-protein kinase